MIDYQAIAAQVRKERNDPSITAEYLESLDNRTNAEWIEHEVARHKQRIKNRMITGEV